MHVYQITSDCGHVVRAVRVKEVILGENNRLSVRLESPFSHAAFGEEFYLTAEEAEEVAAINRPAPFVLSVVLLTLGLCFALAAIFI